MVKTLRCWVCGAPVFNVADRTARVDCGDCVTKRLRTVQAEELRQRQSVTPELLKAFRKERHWNQSFLAARAGVPVAAIKRAEKGDEPPVLKLVEYIQKER